MILDGIHLNDKGQENYCKWISDYCFEYAEKTDFGKDTEEDNSNTETESESANGSENEQSKDDSSSTITTVNTGMSTTEIAIAAIVTFIGISVFGILFIKTVQKNKR